MVTKKKSFFQSQKHTIQKFPKIMSLWRYSRGFNLKNTLLWLENKNVGIFLNFHLKNTLGTKIPKNHDFGAKKSDFGVFSLFLGFNFKNT